MQYQFTWRVAYSTLMQEENVKLRSSDGHLDFQVLWLGVGIRMGKLNRTENQMLQSTGISCSY